MRLVTTCSGYVCLRLERPVFVPRLKNVSAERSGSAVRDLQPLRLSFCTIERREVGQRREGCTNEVKRLQRRERREVGQCREGFAVTEVERLSDVSAERSGSTVRELHQLRLSVCTDVSAEVGQRREGLQPLRLSVARSCTATATGGGPAVPSRSISVESRASRRR